MKKEIEAIRESINKFNQLHNKDIKFNLRDADLRGVDLTNADLKGSYLNDVKK